MRNAWMLILAPASLGMMACGGPTTPVDGGNGGTDTGFIPLVDSGTDAATLPGRDGGRDAAPYDGNITPYDGGAAFTCTGLTPVTPSTYCAAYADSWAAEYTRCGLADAAGAMELRAAILRGCDLSAIDASVTAGRATWDAAMAACCLGHSSHDTSCFYNPGGGADECDFLHGTVANGSACTTGADCTNGYCRFDDACGGTCTAYAATGDDCDPNLGDVTCAPDARCDTTTRRCTTETGTAGMACSETANTGCLPTIACIDPDGDGNGTCTDLPSRGDVCTTDTILCDLNSGVCHYDFAAEAGLCAPALPVGTAGCLIDAQCAGDAYCRGANFGMMMNGTCTARAHRGASCATDKCVNGLVCRPDRTCGDSPALGEMCTPTSGCTDSQCSGGGTCIARYAGGMHCTRNDQCASGLCRPMSMTCAAECP